MFEVIPYKRAYFKELSHYISRYFKPKYILTHQSYFDWQYGKSFYLLRANDKIAGHFGYRDIEYKSGSDVQKIRVLMNMFVAPEVRVFGAGALLAQTVFKIPYPILVCGYTPLLHRLCSRLNNNWKELGNLTRWIRVLKKSHRLIPDVRLPSSSFSLNWENFPGLDFSEIKKPTGSLKEIWPRFENLCLVTVKRDLEYIEWRFFDHPMLKYTFLVAWKGKSPQGYLAGRMEEDQGFKIYRIVDLLAEEKVARGLIDTYVKMAIRKGADMVDFLFSGNLHNQPLLSLGFFDSDNTTLADFPILFSPISKKKKFINIAGTIDFPLNDCYFTKADGDQDRPNPH